MARYATWPQWGKPCAVCGKPVHPPVTIHEKAAQAIEDRIWHGACFPPMGVTGTFTVSGTNEIGGGGGNG